MPRFRLKPWMILAVVLILLVAAFFGTFFINSPNGRQSTGAENIAGSAAAPVVSGASGFAASVKDFFSRLFGLRDIDKEYAALKERNMQLELANQFMADLQQENERLNDMLGYKQQYPDFNFVPARVIGKAPGSWFIDFTLDKGSKQGVAINDTVVNELGLIGRIYDVGSDWCKAMAIIDRQSSVSVVIERSRDNGIVEGLGDPQGSKPVCNIMYLSIDADVEPGDRVLTTDLGGFFPKGIVVGTVLSVSRDQKSMNAAVMEPAVDFARIEDVLIINNSGKTITEADIAKEQEQKAQQEKTQEAGN